MIGLHVFPGDLQNKPIFCVRSKQWLVKKERLVYLAVECRKDQTVVYKEPESQPPKPNIPANIAAVPKLAKPAAITQNKERFTS
jgi:hypothetical protein